MGLHTFVHKMQTLSAVIVSKDFLNFDIINLPYAVLNVVFHA